MATLVPAVRLLDREVDNRISPSFPIVRTAPVVVVVADGQNSKSETIALNGEILSIASAAPAIPTDATFTVEILDEDGNQYHITGGIADNGNVYTDISSNNVVVVGIVTITVAFVTVLSGNTATFDLVFLLQSRV